MSLGCLRLAVSRAARVLCPSTMPVTLLLLFKPCSSRTASAYLGITLQRWSPFSTSPGNDEKTEPQEEEEKKKKKKRDPKARIIISSVGRKIHQRYLLLLDEDGKNLGTVHRADALRLMDEKGLKLVPVNKNAEPPVYRLMSGKQIHEAQMELREKQKTKMTGIVQLKDLTLSSDIAPHDLDTKLKQVTSWLKKKNHVRVTLKPKRDQRDQPLDSILEEMIGRITMPLGFVNKPKLLREGQAASCVLRLLSAKELRALGSQPATQTASGSAQLDAAKQDRNSKEQ